MTTLQIPYDEHDQKLQIIRQSMVYSIVECHPVLAVMCNISVNATIWNVMIIFTSYSPSDINRRINKYYEGTIDQHTHTLAQLIFELVMARDGEWSLSDSNFTKDDISAATEHLRTVRCPCSHCISYCLCWCIILVVLSFYCFFCFFFFYFYFYILCVWGEY